MTSAWDREVLADLAIPGDPDAVTTLSNWFRSLANNVANAQQRFTALAGYDPGTWTGDAADAFAAALKDLPAQLGEVQSAYDHMAWLLWVYGNSLTDLQRQSHQCAVTLNDAQDAYRRALQACEQSGGVPFSDSSVQSAQATLDAAQAKAAAVYDQFRAAVDTARGEISNAKATIGNTFGSAIGRWGGDVAGVAYNVVINPIKSLPGDVADFIEHPSWSGFGKILGDLGSIAMIAALLVPGLGEALVPAVFALDVAKTSVDVVGLATGDPKENVGVIGVDLLSTACDGVGGIAGRGADAGDEAMQQGIKSLSLAQVASDAGEHQVASAALQDALDNFGKQGVGDLLSGGRAFTVDGWSEIGRNFASPKAWAQSFASNAFTTGVEDYSSSAAVLLHRVDFAFSNTSTIIGGLQANHRLPDYTDPEPVILVN